MARVLDLGVCGYEAAWDIQKELAEKLIAGEGEETLIFVEHPHVLTLGANFHEENLLFTAEKYASMGVEVIRTDRGGDVTYHGPRQLVIYPIFDIARHGKDLHRWMRDLEETMIRTIAEFGVEGRRFAPHTGVWVGDRKIAAIGVKIKKWVNLHGIALNCNNDLAYFDMIVPCGIVGYGVTSLTRETGREVTIEDAKPAVARAFEEVFGVAFPD
jgi:lipoyl(octanoyl) transferase